jgi:flavoprotein
MISKEVIESYEVLRLVPNDSDDTFQRYLSTTGEEIQYYPLTNKMEIYHNNDLIALIGNIEYSTEFVILMKLLQFNLVHP